LLVLLQEVRNVINLTYSMFWLNI